MKKKRITGIISKARKFLASPAFRCMAVTLCLLVTSMDVFASSGANILNTQVNENIARYWGPVSAGIRIIGGIVGGIGGLRVYNKWQNGEQDTQKSIVAWLGALIFILLIPNLISALFGISAS